MKNAASFGRLAVPITDSFYPLQAYLSKAVSANFTTDAAAWFLYDI
jgi:hypothetical protein